jgi:hypothetical protein
MNNSQSHRLIGLLNRPRGGQPNPSPRFTNNSSFTGPARFFPHTGNVNSTQVTAGNEAGNQIGGGNQTPIITIATPTVARFNVHILVGMIPVMIPVTVVLGETTPLGNVVDGAGLGQQHTGAVLIRLLEMSAASFKTFLAVASFNSHRSDLETWFNKLMAASAFDATRKCNSNSSRRRGSTSSRR